MKIHITFDKDLLANTEARESKKMEVMKQAGLHDVNDRRFERYGILSGVIDNPSSLSQIKGIPGVASVNADGQKHATSNT